jgi:hypothetical protein
VYVGTTVGIAVGNWVGIPTVVNVRSTDPLLVALLSIVTMLFTVSTAVTVA